MMKDEKGGKKTRDVLSVVLTDEFKAKLIAMRKEKAWTLANLSDRSGVSISTLHTIEKGQRYCRAYTINMIEAAYGLEKNTLYNLARKLAGEKPNTTVMKSVSAASPARQRLSRRKMLKRTARATALAGLSGTVAGAIIWKKNVPRPSAEFLQTMLQTSEHFLKAGRYREAYNNLTIYLEMAGHHLSTQSRMFTMRGQANYWLGDFDMALSDAGQARQLAKHRGSAAIQVEADLVEANVLRSLSRIDEAISLYTQAIQLSLDNNANALAAKGHERLGLLFRVIGDADLALEHFESALLHDQRSK